MTNDMQMVPKLPSYMKEQTGKAYQNSKVNACFLSSKKEQDVLDEVNQTLNGAMCDVGHKKKYYDYLVK